MKVKGMFMYINDADDVYGNATDSPCCGQRQQGH